MLGWIGLGEIGLDKVRSGQIKWARWESGINWKFSWKNYQKRELLKKGITKEGNYQKRKLPEKKLPKKEITKKRNY
jgi:hypothetical protein